MKTERKSREKCERYAYDFGGLEAAIIVWDNRSRTGKAAARRAAKELAATARRILADRELS